MVGERDDLPSPHRPDPRAQHSTPAHSDGGAVVIGGLSPYTPPIVASMSITVSRLEPAGGTPAWQRPCCDVEVLINDPMRPTRNSGFWEALSLHLRHALDWDLTSAYFPRQATSRLTVILVTGVPEDSIDAPLIDAVRGYLEDKGYLQRA